jgi:hypothetical protein
MLREFASFSGNFRGLCDLAPCPVAAGDNARALEPVERKARARRGRPYAAMEWKEVAGRPERAEVA